MGNNTDDFSDLSDFVKQSALGEQATTIRNNIYNVSNDNPDKAAQHLEMAKITGVPLPTVQNMPNEIKQQAAAKSIDAEAITAQAPATAKMLADPTGASISHDDVPNLMALESTVNPRPGLGADVGAGINSTLLGITGAYTKANILLSSMFPSGSAASMTPEQTAQQNALAQNLEIASAKNAPQRWTGLMAGVIPYLPFGPFAAPMIGGTEGYKTTTNLEAQGVDPFTAEKAGVLSGGLQAGAMFMPMGKFALGEGARALVKSVGTSTLKAAGVGAAQSLATDEATSVLLKGAGYPDLAQQYQPTVDKTLEGAAFMAAMHVGMQGVHAPFQALSGKVAADDVRVQQAQHNEQVLSNIDELAAANKVRGRSQESFDAWVKDATENAPVKELYINADALAQSAGENLPLLEERSPAIKEQLQTALATGGDIRIPLEEYTSKIAGTDLSQMLLQHLKTEPDGYSKAEADKYMTEQGPQLQAEVEKVLAEKQNDDVFKTSRDNVEAGVLEQLKTANRFPDAVNKPYAQLMSNFYAVQAARLGITPEEMAAQYPVKIENKINIAPQFNERAGSSDNTAPLVGLPSSIKVDGKKVEFGPYQPARKAAEDYANSSGLQIQEPRTYAKVDEARAKRIADEFEKMKHEPNNPEVKAAYDAMIKETMAQWEAIKKTGLKVEFIQGDDPYGNPRNAILDVVNNNHLWVYPTEEGFGGSESANVDISGNPLLAPTNEMISGRKAQVNDIFRIVHDYFGHIKEGVGFRAEGEENAWRAHSGMYSNLARRAMTTETRGQNSWVNFGPHAEHNKTASAADTQYAPQKIGLLPEWVSEEGAKDEQPVVEQDYTKHGTLLNVGLATNDGKGITPEQVKAELAKLGVTVTEEAQAQSSTEPTFIGKLSRPLTKDEADELSKALDQEAITQLADGKGDLYGPLASQWGPFNPDYFVTLDGKRLSEDKEFNQAASIKQTDTPEFKKWFGDSKVVDADGKPLVVYHGTTQDFEVFDKNKSNPESDMGAGFYFTDNPGDVANNYAGFGPDLTQKIELKAERLADEISDYYEEKGGAGNDKKAVAAVKKKYGAEVYNENHMDMARNIVREEFASHEGATMPVFVKMEHPVEIGGDKETRFDYEEKYDEENDTYAEPSGSLVKVIEAVRSVADEQGFDAQNVIGAIMSEHFDGDYIGAHDLIGDMKGAEALMYAGGEGGLVGSELVRQIFHEAGYDGFIDHTVDGKWGSTSDRTNKMKGMSPDTTHYIAFDRKQIKSAIGNSGKFDPNNPSILKQEPPEGWGTADTHAPDSATPTGVKGGFNPANLTISLYKGADLSTFLHESGHFFLHVMADIAGRADAPAEVKGDVQKLMDWFGVKDVEAWNNLSIDEQRPHHEQLARSFEKYLIDGEAPSLELQPIFQRFRAWLLNVYKSTASFLFQNPNAGQLNDEVRRVFDRMLATADQIKQAENARGLEPMFKTPEEAGMNDEAFRDYNAQDNQATQDGISELESRRLRDMQWMDNARSKEMRRIQRDAASKRAEIKKEVTDEVKKEPVYQAERFIRHSDDAGALLSFPHTETENGTKLDLGALKQMYGDKANAIWRNLDTGKYGLAADGGVHPDAIAERFGFSSGDELVRALLAAEPMREKINGITDQRTLERHGDLTDPGAMARAADKAVHNEARTKIITTEMKALDKKLGNKPLLAKAVKQFAENMIARQSASKINPNQYIAAAARAGKASAEAFRTGDLKEAAAQKRNQLVNNYAVKAAFEAQKAVESVLAQAKKLTNDGYRARLPGSYLEQIDGILSQYDLRKNPSGEPSKKQVSLQKWVESQREAGYEPAVKDWMIDDPRRISFKDMTVEEVKGLGDTLKSLVHMARQVKEITVKGQRVELDGVVADLLKPLIERGDKFTKDELLNPPKKGTDSFLTVALYKMQSALRAINVDLKPQEYKRNQYDLHELEGPFGKYLFEPMFDRNYWKVDQLRAISKEMGAVGDKLGATWRKSLTNLVTNKTLVDPDLTTDPKAPVFMKITRSKLLSIMAHVGNESNFDKLTRGYNWDAADVWRFVHENATKEDWDAVQAQGKVFDKYWPDIEGLARRLGGVPPEKIPLRPVATKYGTYDGWYAPIDYDPIRSKLSAKYGDIMADPTEQIGNAQSYRATTTFNGSAQNRSAGYTDRVNLDYHGFEQRLRDTIHDLAYREALIDFNKIVNHDKFRDQFLRTFGKEEYKGLIAWARGIRDVNRDESQIKGFEKFMQYSRQGVIMTGIAYRLSTVLKHGSSAALKTLGYLGDAPGMKYFASRAARMATGNASADIQGAMEKFSEIRTRASQMDRDYKVGTRSLYEAEDWRAKNDRFGHAMVAWSDLITAVPTAWAAYDRAINEGVPVKQGGTGKPATEAQAVAYANKIVREAHGTALESTRSQFMQAKGVKGLFGTIYGFMNNSYGQNADLLDKMVTGGSKFNDKPAAFARALGTIIAPAMMAAWVSGQLHNDDDNKNPAFKSVPRAVVMEMAGTVPFVRDAAAAIEYNRIGEAGQVAPIQIMGDTMNAVKDLYNETQGKDTRAIQNVANAVGELAHIGGLGQAGKTLQYMRDVHTGKQQPKTTKDVLTGLTIGPPPKHK